MPIKFNCESCGARIRVPEKAAGKRVRCPKCETIQRVPEGAGDAAEAPDAPAAPGGLLKMDDEGGSDGDPLAALAAAAGDDEAPGGPPAQPAPAAPAAPARPTPQPKAPAGSGGGQARTLPLSSHPSSYRPAAQPQPLSDQPGRPQRKPRPAPKYLPIVIAGWTIRATAALGIVGIIVFALVTTIIALTSENGAMIAATLGSGALMIVLAVFYGIVLFGLAEVMFAIRDIARNSYRW